MLGFLIFLSCGLCESYKILFRQTRKSSQLNSFGDPDLSSKSNFYRKLQNFIRDVDTKIFPTEVDVPGVTFLSRVEWAPWMETIWFGNIYEYRSAYFQDVMYSNNKPNREGALLYSDSYRSLMIALLYQRYKRFDTTSYNLSNATYFNVFGGETLRIGRYKIPQTDELILCTTDPLTYTEMKRYLNSFAPTKLFQSKYFQQKRKRQYLMNIADTTATILPSSTSTVSTMSESISKSNEKDDQSNKLSNFFLDAIYMIEYGRMAMSMSHNKENYVTIPIGSLSSDSLNDIMIINTTIPSLSSSTTSSSSSISSISSNSSISISSRNPSYIEKSTLIIPTSLANSQYFYENLFQTILTYINSNYNTKRKKMKVLLGGDGRLLNDYAIEIGTRISVANNINSIEVNTNQLLSTSEITQSIMTMNGVSSSSNKESSTSSSTGPNIIINLTSKNKKGGIKGVVGLDVYLPTSYHAFNMTDWQRILSEMMTRQTVRMTASRYLYNTYKNQFIPFLTSYTNGELSATSGRSPVTQAYTTKLLTTTSIDTNTIRQTWMNNLQTTFDFKKIKMFLEVSNLFMTIDMSNSPVNYGLLSPILKLMKYTDEDTYLNVVKSGTSTYMGDFLGLVPSADINDLEDSRTLFSIPKEQNIVSYNDIRQCISEIELEMFNEVNMNIEEDDDDDNDDKGDGKEVNDTLTDMVYKSNTINTSNNDVTTTNTNTSNSSTLSSTSTSISSGSGSGMHYDRSQYDYEDCPDIGFAFNADTSECLVLGPGFYITPKESLEFLQYYLHNTSTTTNMGDKSMYIDGVTTMLSWLTLLSNHYEMKKELPDIRKLYNDWKYRSKKTIRLEMKIKTSMNVMKNIYSKYQQLYESMTNAAAAAAAATTTMEDEDYIVKSGDTNVNNTIAITTIPDTNTATNTTDQKKKSKKSNKKISNNVDEDDRDVTTDSSSSSSSSSTATNSDSGSSDNNIENIDAIESKYMADNSIETDSDIEGEKEKEKEDDSDIDRDYNDDADTEDNNSSSADSLSNLPTLPPITPLFDMHSIQFKYPYINTTTTTTASTTIIMSTKTTMNTTTVATSEQEESDEDSSTNGDEKSSDDKKDDKNTRNTDYVDSSTTSLSAQTYLNILNNTIHLNYTTYPQIHTSIHISDPSALVLLATDAIHSQNELGYQSLLKTLEDTDGGDISLSITAAMDLSTNSMDPLANSMNRLELEEKMKAILIRAVTMTLLECDVPDFDISSIIDDDVTLNWS